MPRSEFPEAAEKVFDLDETNTDVLASNHVDTSAHAHGKGIVSDPPGKADMCAPEQDLPIGHNLVLTAPVAISRAKQVSDDRGVHATAPDCLHVVAAEVAYNPERIGQVIGERRASAVQVDDGRA